MIQAGPKPEAAPTDEPKPARLVLPNMLLKPLRTQKVELHYASKDGEPRIIGWGAQQWLQGDASMLIDGAPAAYQGCKTACGATLIASQSVSTTQPGSAEAPMPATATALAARGAGAISDTLAARYQDEPLDESGDRFRGRFQVLDLATGEPVGGQAMRVRSTGGQHIAGITDAEG